MTVWDEFPAEDQAPQQQSNAGTSVWDEFPAEKEMLNIDIYGRPPQEKQKPLAQAIKDRINYLFSMESVNDVNKFGDKYLAPIGAGALQGAGDIPKNIANFALSPLSKATGRDLTLKTPDLKQFLPEQSPLTEGLFLGGEIAGSLNPGAAAYKLAGKIPGMAKGVTGALGRGALTGAAISPEGTRDIGAVLGGALSPLTKIPSLTKEGIGKKIVQDFKDLKKGFSNEYSNLWKEAADKGIKNIPRNFSTKQAREIVRNTPKKYHESLVNYYKTRSLKDAHKAQSEIGKYVSLMEGKTDLTPSQIKTLRAAQKVRDDLNMSIYREMMKKGGLDMPFKYHDISNRYGQVLGPYLDNAAIRKAAMSPTKKGAINPARLTEKFQQQSSDPFIAAMGKKYPEIGINQKFNSPLVQELMKKTIQGVGLGVGGTAAYNLLARKF